MDPHGQAELENQFGRGVYCTDSLVSSGVFAPSPSPEQRAGGGLQQTRAPTSTLEDAIGAQLARSAPPSSSQLSALLDSLPSSLAKQVSHAASHGSHLQWQYDELICFLLISFFHRPACFPCCTCPRATCTPLQRRTRGG